MRDALTHLVGLLAAAAFVVLPLGFEAPPYSTAWEPEKCLWEQMAAPELVLEALPVFHA